MGGPEHWGRSAEAAARRSGCSSAAVRRGVVDGHDRPPADGSGRLARWPVSPLGRSGCHTRCRAATVTVDTAHCRRTASRVARQRSGCPFDVQPRRSGRTATGRRRLAGRHGVEARLGDDADKPPISRAAAEQSCECDGWSENHGCAGDCDAGSVSPCGHVLCLRGRSHRSRSIGRSQPMGIDLAEAGATGPSVDQPMTPVGLSPKVADHEPISGRPSWAAPRAIGVGPADGGERQARD